MPLFFAKTYLLEESMGISYDSVKQWPPHVSLHVSQRLQHRILSF